MLKYISLLIFFVSLSAQSGLVQKHLVFASEVLPIEIQFDLPIDKHSLGKKTIVVKNSKNKKIKGSTKIKNRDTLVFYNEEALDAGIYKVKVKKISLFDYNKNTRFQKTAKKICSFFYDDVKECKMYRYASRVKSKKIKYSFEIEDDQLEVISLSLSRQSLELSLDEVANIDVIATYEDNTSADVTNDVVWSMSNDSILSIANNLITPLNEGVTTLQASYNSIKTPIININTYKEINGYRLPPEPDEALNNSTLLGIDVNGNGVRDDVERKVIETYKEPIKIELMMTYNRVAQKILENPVSLAQEYQKEFTRVGDCEWYIIDQNVSIDAVESVEFMQKNTYNTKIRVRAYLDYNIALSGGVYGSGPSDWTADACDFDVELMLKDEK